MDESWLDRKAGPEQGRRPDWMDNAACQGVDPDLFFPTPQRGETSVNVIRLIQATCHVCPVMLECREYGMGERHGVWGGWTELDRRVERRRRRRLRLVSEDG